MRPIALALLAMFLAKCGEGLGSGLDGGHGAEGEAEAEGELDGGGEGMPKEIPCDPIPAGCWLADWSQPCDWGWLKGSLTGCARALIACGVQTTIVNGFSEAAIYEGAAEYCWNYCTPGAGDVYPDGGTLNPSPIQQGGWLSCAGACVDDARLPDVRISVFPCSVCAEIMDHTVQPPETCAPDAGPPQDMDKPQS